MLTTESRVLAKFIKTLKATVKEFEKDMSGELEDDPDTWVDVSESDLWERFAGYCGTEEE